MYDTYRLIAPVGNLHVVVGGVFVYMLLHGVAYVGVFTQKSAATG